MSITFSVITDELAPDPAVGIAFAVANGLDRVDIRSVGGVNFLSLDRDEQRRVARQIRDATSLPMTVLGGAGSLQDIGQLIAEFGVHGASAGSLFVFKGIYMAVLINYPGAAERDRLIRQSLGLA